MLEGLEKLKVILQEKLSDDEVERILAELTVASGEGSVSIGGDATEAVIVTGDNNQVVINHSTEPELIREIVHAIAKNMQYYSSQTADRKSRTVRGKVAGNNTATAVKPPPVKKSICSPKKPNTTRISKNISILNNSRNSVPTKDLLRKSLED